MTLLPNQATIDALGIDTFERAFVYATLLLKQALTDQPEGLGDSNNARNAIQVAIQQNKFSGIFLTKITIPLDRETYLKSGGDFILSILSMSDLTGIADYLPMEPTENNTIPLEPYPERINSLEKYIVWLTKIILKKALEQLYLRIPFIPRRQRVLTITLDLAIEAFELEINASLSFDWIKYLESGNLIQSIDTLLVDPATLPVIEDEPQYAG
jgi:hypothetical protein